MFQRIAVIVGVAFLVAAGIARTSDQAAETDQPANVIPHDTALEKIPAAEEGQIKNIVKRTVEQMKARYQGKPPILRGVHPKDHGCVEATFQILDADKLPPKYRVGVFAEPGKKYKAWIRFSTSGVMVAAKDSDPPASRGMAIQLLNVEGKQLVKKYNEPFTQDFLMLNHPVFAFSNVEDYEAFVDGDNSFPKFFKDRIQLDSPMKDMTNRAQRSMAILGRIGSPAVPITAARMIINKLV